MKRILLSLIIIGISVNLLFAPPLVTISNIDADKFNEISDDGGTYIVNEGLANKSQWEMHSIITNVTTSTTTFPGSIIKYTLLAIGGTGQFKGATGNTWQTIPYSGAKFVSPQYDILPSSPSYIITTGLSTSASYYLDIYGVR